MHTSSASARSQPTDLHSGSSTPGKATSRPSHRLQVQSTPSAAQKTVHGRDKMQEVKLAAPSATWPDPIGPVAVRPDAVGPDAAGPHMVGSDAAGPDAARLGAHTMASSSGRLEEKHNLRESEVVHVVADAQSMGDCATTTTGHASRLEAAKPRLRGLRLPWLTNQAGHSPEQVGHVFTPSDIYQRVSFQNSCICHDCPCLKTKLLC